MKKLLILLAAVGSLTAGVLWKNFLSMPFDYAKSKFTRTEPPTLGPELHLKVPQGEYVVTRTASGTNVEFKLASPPRPRG